MSDDVSSSMDAHLQIDAMQAAAAGRAQRVEARQLSSDEGFTIAMEEAFNPFSADKEIEFKSMHERIRRATPKEKQDQPVKRIAAVQTTLESAHRHQQRNPELQVKTLILLRDSILKDDSPNAILEKVMKYYPDVALADEALEFLIETADRDVVEQIRAARELLHQTRGREVAAGRNVGNEARAFAQTGIGTPTSLRDLYRDITGNPREHNALFEELSGKYNFDQLKKVIDFLLRALGSDLKSKGPSIPRGELYRLVTETRVLQSILGVYNFFKVRSDLIAKLFQDSGIAVTSKLGFEQLAKEFIKLVEERYPSAAKVLRLAAQFGIDRNTLAQLILLQQYRDAIRQVAPRIYRSLQHRFDLLKVILEALEELEDELEEEEEKQEEKKKRQKDKDDKE